MATSKSAKTNSARTNTASSGFSAEERAAMRDRSQELKSVARRGSKENGEAAVLEKFAYMTAIDRAIGERLHAIIQATAPALTPRLWYGMPAWVNSDGNVVCFFQETRKFKTRYATLGFSDKAYLDDGPIWPVAFALMDLTAATEARIVALIRKAVS